MIPAYRAIFERDGIDPEAEPSPACRRWWELSCRLADMKAERGRWRAEPFGPREIEAYREMEEKISDLRVEIERYGPPYIYQVFDRGGGCLPRASARYDWEMWWKKRVANQPKVAD